MTPGTYNFTIYQGSTFKKSFTIQSGLDFDDYESVKMQIRLFPDGECVFDSTYSNAIAKNSDNIQITITDELTKNFNFVKAGYDIELTKPDGTVDKFMRGEITLIKEYTEDLSI